MTIKKKKFICGIVSVPGPSVLSAGRNEKRRSRRKGEREQKVKKKKKIKKNKGEGGMNFRLCATFG